MHVRCGAAGGHSIRVVLPGVTLYDGELWVPLEGVERVVARCKSSRIRAGSKHQVTGLLVFRLNEHQVTQVGFLYSIKPHAAAKSLSTCCSTRKRAVERVVARCKFSRIRAGG